MATVVVSFLETVAFLFLLCFGTTPLAQKTTVLRRRVQEEDLVDLNLGHASLHLPPPPNEPSSVLSVSCHRTFAEDHGGWHGECDGGYDANFVQSSFNNNHNNDDSANTATFGSFHTDSQVCRVAPDANGRPKLLCIHEEDFDTETDIDLEDTLDTDEMYHRQLADLNVTFAMSHVVLDDTSHHRRRLFDDSGSTIDVLVVWTRYAECVNSGLAEGCLLTAQTESNIRGLINLAVVETNVAFSLSSIRTKLRLVHAYRDNTYVEPPEPSTWTLMLEHLTQVTDGKLDAVHVNRALYGADVVHMIAGSPGSCGAAHIGPKMNRVFSISRTSCATGYFSFGHEIAHTVRVDCINLSFSVECCCL
jgi:Metallo-peptidase family M12B Reprolysin-like